MFSPMSMTELSLALDTDSSASEVLRFCGRPAVPLTSLSSWLLTFTLLLGVAFLWKKSEILERSGLGFLARLPLIFGDCSYSGGCWALAKSTEDLVFCCGCEVVESSTEGLGMKTHSSTRCFLFNNEEGMAKCDCFWRTDRAGVVIGEAFRLAIADAVRMKPLERLQMIL